jgi:enamine deaminase RidA (YjgF/YER057c/UK114 family)
MADEKKADVSYVKPLSLEPAPGYSHVVDVRGSRLIFIAGQTAMNAQGTVVGGTDIEAQTD